MFELALLGEFSNTSLFLYGFLLALSLPIFGAYLIWRNISFISDILGHAYFGAYIILKSLYSPIAWIVSFIISYLLAKSTLSYEEHKKQINIMSIYIIFSVMLLAVINFIKPEAINTIVFGNVFLATYGNLMLLTLELAVLAGIATAYYKQIFLRILNKEFAESIYAGIKSKEFLFLFFVLLIMMHAINIFGILLTVAITLLPYLAIKDLNLGIVQTFVSATIISLISYIIGYYWSYQVDASLAVTYSIVALAIYGALNLYVFLRSRFLSNSS